MGCFYPLAATQLPGGQILVHKRTPGIHQHVTPAGLGRDIKLPCGNCTGCRLERSKQWAIRLMHEAQGHKRNSFITLTYSEEALAARRPTWEPTVPYTPPSRVASPTVDAHPDEPSVPSLSTVDSLRRRDLQLFMKRLRFELTTQGGSASIRFYGVGEYGDLTKRPHYHIALFGEDFSGDRYKWRTSGQYAAYRSPRLEKLWRHGNSEIGDLTFESAAYIARYCMKKINGPKADDHYRRETPEGETIWLEPEFALMSRRPGIGKDWLDQYHADVYPHDFVVVRGRKLKPPRYYDKLLTALHPERMQVIKAERELRALELAADNTPARLAAKEAVTLAKLALKKRQLEK